jgi:hypothetical protein
VPTKSRMGRSYWSNFLCSVRWWARRRKSHPTQGQDLAAHFWGQIFGILCTPLSCVKSRFSAGGCLRIGVMC